MSHPDTKTHYKKNLFLVVPFCFGGMKNHEI